MTATTALPAVPGFTSFQPEAIAVLDFLNTDAAHTRLRREHEAALQRSAKSQTARALQSALFALNLRAEETMLRVQARGQLLMCWHGTKFIGEGAYQ